jgi:hypothetical protein
MNAEIANDSLQRAPWWHGALIAVLGAPLLAGCLTASFLKYDDPVHTQERARPGDEAGAEELLRPKENATYFPVTELSYRLDRALFESASKAAFGSWAPAARLMTLLYHACAALLLWRIMLALRFSPLQALFMAAVFAAHPLACETVCWVSERKNALAGCFGFAALLAWLRLEGAWLRLPVTFGLYGLALLSKPSALGLLPIFVLVELFGGVRGIAGHTAGQASSGTTPSPYPLPQGEGGTLAPWRTVRGWVKALAWSAPLAAAAGVVIALNLSGHEKTLLPPPGGTVFTAALTDLEILCRYLFNLAAPVALSAAYYVAPVTTLLDWRVAAYGGLLAALIAATVSAAGNRRRAVFGWLWFFAALGPSLNLIAISHLMNDRYIYLSTPGFLIVLVEVARGLQARWPAACGSVFRIGAPVYVALLLALASVRGAAWSNTLALFEDAVAKQPQSSFAHYCLGVSYAQAWHMMKNDARADAKQTAEAHARWVEHWRKSVECPDADRALFYSMMANRVGEELQKAGDAAQAKRYFTMAANPPPQLPAQAHFRERARASLEALGKQR